MLLKMRRPLLAAAAFLLLAAPAAALSITPDPVNHSRTAAETGGPLDADVTLVSAVGDTLTFQLSVTTGSITRLDFSFLGSPTLAGPSFNFTTGGSVSGAGIGGTATDVFGTEVQVVFDESVDAGESSGLIAISFASSVVAGYEGAIAFDNGFAVDETYLTELPEPATALLLASALALVGRRRR
jgi:hypothetical protein